jgi:biopolymer transport protein ExbB
MNIVEFFLKGGPIMWPLLLSSVVTVSIVVDRVIFLWKAQRGRSSCDFKEIQFLVREGQTANAAAKAEVSSDVVVRVVGAGLQYADSCFAEAVSCAASKELSQYEKGLGVLDTAITLAPLLGLLGTVTGMISSFGILGASELEAPAAITGGIAEALIATAFGLGIAIAALLPMNLLNSKREQLQREIEEAATEIEIALKSKPVKAQLKQLRAL